MTGEAERLIPKKQLLLGDEGTARGQRWCRMGALSVGKVGLGAQGCIHSKSDKENAAFPSSFSGKRRFGLAKV